MKEIIFDSSIEEEIKLDTNITEELKQEGSVRELVRALQGMRKDLGLKPVNQVSIFVYGQPTATKVFEDNKGSILKEARGKNIYIGLRQDVKSDLEKEIIIDGREILLGIKK